MLGLRRVGRDAPDGKSHEDGFAVDRFLIVEIGAIVLEFAGPGNARRLFLPREGDHPIFAGIRREGPLKARPIGRDVGVGVADEDVSSVE